MGGHPFIPLSLSPPCSLHCVCTNIPATHRPHVFARCPLSGLACLPVRAKPRNYTKYPLLYSHTYHQLTPDYYFTPPFPEQSQNTRTSAGHSLGAYSPCTYFLLPTHTPSPTNSLTIYPHASNPPTTRLSMSRVLNQDIQNPPSATLPRSSKLRKKKPQRSISLHTFNPPLVFPTCALTCLRRGTALNPI